MKALIVLLASVSLAFAGDDNPLASSDPAVARQAIATWIGKGEEALPELRTFAASDDPRLRARANEALGGITGQWGSHVDLVWKRSLAEAVKASNGKKPLLMLHLFGEFDEEFC